MKRGMVLIGLNLLPKRTALLFLKMTSQISTKNNEKKLNTSAKYKITVEKFWRIQNISRM